MRTLALIKPDAVAYGQAGRIIIAIENSGLGIMHIQSYMMSRDQARWFYGKQHRDRPYFDELCEFMSKGMTIAIVLQGPNAVEDWRSLVGPADPKLRQPWHIRKRFEREADRMVENRVHGSDSRESYMHECAALGLTAWL